jgi:hypothetical protein
MDVDVRSPHDAIVPPPPLPTASGSLVWNPVGRPSSGMSRLSAGIAVKQASQARVQEPSGLACSGHRL